MKLSNKDLTRFNSKFSKHNGCWEWNCSTTTQGYGRFKVGREWILAHRLAYFLNKKTILPPDILVCHHCDNRKCVNPKHLFSGSHHDNRMDASRKGRLATGLRNGWYTHPEKRITGNKHWTHLRPTDTLRGEKNPSAKLTDHIIKQIRALYKTGLFTTGQLGKCFGVTQSNIVYILKKKSWKHV